MDFKSCAFKVVFLVFLCFLSYCPSFMNLHRCVIIHTNQSESLSLPATKYQLHKITIIVLLPVMYMYIHVALE